MPCLYRELSLQKKEPDLAMKQSRAVDYNLVLSVYEKKLSLLL